MKIEKIPGFGALEICKDSGDLAFTISERLLDHPALLRDLLKLAEAGGGKAIRTVEVNGRHWVQVPE